jgi:protein SCO1/2
LSPELHLSHRIVAVAAAVALTLGAASAYLASRPPEIPDIPGLLWPQSKPLTSFALQDHGHGRFDLERLKGTWTLLFFGYTHCPDVCPVTLAVLRNVAALMKQGGKEVSPPQVVFVSVDPERDTLEHLAVYVTHFDPGFLGVTGSDEQLTGLTRQLGVLHIRTEPDAHGEYLVDHTAAVFLIDPRGHLLAVFQAPHDAVAMAENLPKIQELPPPRS